LASILRLPSGNWRVQVRRQGRYISETFRRRNDAEAWALENECRIDRGEKPRTLNQVDPTTFGHLIDLHLADMQEVGKCARRSKAFSLERLKRKLGSVRIADLNRERLVAFGRDREGAGPPTIGADLSYVTTVISHAAAVHGTAVSVEPVNLARIALKRLRLIGKAKSRERRPTQDELDRIISYLEQNPRQYIPVGRVARFAIATAMRLDEICHLCWQDVNAATKTVIVRDRKDPRNKTGNHQKIPLLDATGIDAWAVLEEQKGLTGKSERIFPYSGPSVGTAFRRAF
jgi:integrase